MKMKCRSCGHEWDFRGIRKPRCGVCKSRKVSEVHGKEDENFEELFLSDTEPVKVLESTPNCASLTDFHRWLGGKQLYEVKRAKRVLLYKEYLEDRGFLKTEYSHFKGE